MGAAAQIAAAASAINIDASFFISLFLWSCPLYMPDVPIVVD